MAGAEGYPQVVLFWKLAESRSFYTVPEDHGNCSIGSVTHGFKTLEEVSSKQDIEELRECGWLQDPDEIHLPAISVSYPLVYYGPLSKTPIAPDVVLFRLNAKQLMVLQDALADLAIEGKPQCHIVPMAMEMGRSAVSVGCMLSRIRTGLPPSEVVCALPYARMPEVVAEICDTAEVESAVARFAATDSGRFPVSGGGEQL